MSYHSALEAAGAEVHAFEHFGDYQGTWLAKVTYEGTTGFVEGSYGSCSGCDAFEAEFGWSYRSTGDDLANFGRSYLDNIQTADEVITIHSRDFGWDYEAKDVIAWIEENR